MFDELTRLGLCRIFVNNKFLAFGSMNLYEGELVVYADFYSFIGANDIKVKTEFFEISKHYSEYIINFGWCADPTNILDTEYSILVKNNTPLKHCIGITK